MIQIVEHPEGCILPVRAQPGARRNAVQGEVAGALKIAVTAPPDKGKANRALVETLQDVLGMKASQIELLSGPTSRQKKFLIRGIPRLELEAKLAKILVVAKA
jgi:uncharacterized protein